MTLLESLQTVHCLEVALAAAALGYIYHQWVLCGERARGEKSAPRHAGFYM